MLRQNLKKQWRKNGTVIVSPIVDRSLKWSDSVTKPLSKGARWKSLIRSGACATTQLVGEKRDYEYSPGFIEVEVVNQAPLPGTETVRWQWAGAISQAAALEPASDPALLVETVADNQAKQCFVRKARKHQTQFQSGVFLGELGETLRMIKNPARSLRRGLDDYLNALQNKRMRLRGPDKARFISETWLSYAYGWKPLFSDIDSGARALAKRATRPFEIAQRIHCVGKTDSPVISGVSTTSEGGVTIKYRVITRERIHVVYIGAVRSDSMNNPTFDAQLFGFDPTNWVPTVWELVPYSFLVDYFTNIGEILDAWSFQRTGVSWVQRTVIKEIHRSLYDVQPDWAQYSLGVTRVNSFVPEIHSLARKRVQRALYGGNFVPSFEFQIPGIGSTKWLNITALARAKRMTPF